jgi:hypothetical protein
LHQTFCTSQWQAACPATAWDEANHEPALAKVLVDATPASASATRTIGRMVASAAGEPEKITRHA